MLDLFAQGLRRSALTDPWPICARLTPRLAQKSASQSLPSQLNCYGLGCCSSLFGDLVARCRILSAALRLCVSALNSSHLTEWSEGGSAEPGVGNLKRSRRMDSGEAAGLDSRARVGGADWRGCGCGVNRRVRLRSDGSISHMTGVFADLLRQPQDRRKAGESSPFPSINQEELKKQL